MSNSFELFLAQERAVNSSKHANVSLLSHFGVITLTVSLLSSNFSLPKLIVWAGLALCIALLDWYWNRDYRVLLARPAGSVLSRSRTIASFMVGVMWGVVPVIFFTDQSTSYTVFIVAIYAGYVSGALAVSFSHAPSFIAFTLGISIPMAGRMFYQGGELYGMIGGLMMFYIAMLTYVSQNLDSLFVESTRSKFENAVLLEDLAKEKEAVEQAVASKDRFLASASHDLRQPLNAITLFVDALAPIQTKPLGDEIIGKIKLSLKGLNGMLHSLLDISRLDAQAIDNQPKHISLHTLTAQLVQEYQETKAGDLKIDLRIEASTTVFVDPTLLYRVIRNLLDNAIKFTNTGGVNISTAVFEDYVDLSVLDSGVGIPEDKLKLVFDEFEQLNNPERNREKGLGLGLAIVKRLCNIANIGLSIDSTVGKGTSVGLRLPRGKRDLIAEQTPDLELDLSACLVVVIDDEAHILQATQVLLQSWGCTVVTADGLDSALKQLASTEAIPDFIISDFRLKDGAQGTDAIELIRDEYNQEIPALLITGDTAPDRISAAKSYGIDVIYKPFEAKDLKRELITSRKAYLDREA